MCLLRDTHWGFYIPEDGILHGHSRGNPKSIYNVYARNKLQTREILYMDMAHYYSLRQS
jgi:hypothetical protein